MSEGQNMDKKSPLSRRHFVKTTAMGTGLMLAESQMRIVSAEGSERKRYALVGTGSRSHMYRRAVEEEFKDTCQMVGFCDVNQGRLELAQADSKNRGNHVPIYNIQDDPKAFDKMVAETKPSTIIVTTVDGFHHKYIIRAMELGCDVITEKPMTIDEKKCQEIVDTQAKTKRKCTVTFNYRYSPPRTQVKDLLMNGEIGDILSVDFHWMLNTHHGADYFRRWHSQKKFSGGLMVHKATHHFDLINWWLSAIPVSVFATGKRDFYTPKMAKRFGLKSHHERCLTCPEKNACGFYMNIERGGLKRLYLDNEVWDGYYRDRCVFRPGIDIEDTMNVVVNYDNSCTLCYSLNAFNSWEGYYVIFNGTKGRLEHKVAEKIYINDASDTTQGAINMDLAYTRILPLRDPGYQVEMWSGEGGHGGGDKVLLNDIFGQNPPADKYLRAADQRSGAYSILTGVAANVAFKTKKPVQIADLVQNIGRPDYPEMPNHEDPLPMPGKA